MEKPYVISAELDLQSRAGDSLINTNKLEFVRESLDADLRAAGKNTIWIGSDEIVGGINKHLHASNLPIISLDDRYLKTADGRLGISRSIAANLEALGYAPRRQYPVLNEQFDAIAALGGEVQLVDDVIFSGDMMAWVANELVQRNVKVGRVVCGVAIGEGIQRLQNIGIECSPVVSFDDVEDEICERDFFVVRGSGRRIQELDANALYFDAKNGKPEQWASLPASMVNIFCRQSLERSLALIRPDVTMSQTGSFLGYKNNRTVQESIKLRLQEEL